MNKDIEINGNMNLGAYSPLELDEEQQLNELSNQLLANYMKKAKSQDRNGEETKKSESSIRSMIREGLAELAGEQSGEDVYTMEDWRRDGTLKVKEGQLISPEVFYQLLESVPPMSTGKIFQVGEAYDHDFKTGQALYQTFQNEGDDYYRYIGLRPSVRYRLSESKIIECIQKEIVKVLSKYTQGKASAEKANKAIMDLANSGNGKKKVNESSDSKYVLYADTSRSGNSDFISYTNEGIEKGNIKYMLKYLPEESIIDKEEHNKPVSHKDIEKKGEICLEKEGYVVIWKNDKKQNIYVYKKQNAVNESMDLDAEISMWQERDRSEFGQVLKQLETIAEEGLIDAGNVIHHLRLEYGMDGKMATTTKSVIYYLQEYDFICVNEDGTIDVENSNSPEAAQLCIKLKELSKQQPLNESYAKDGNYTHFAVHKTSNKIVNGWDYSGYDNAELRQFAKDYFFNDLIDYDLDPKQYTILTVQGCRKHGIDPFDDTQWANGYELNEKKR